MSAKPRIARSVLERGSPLPLSVSRLHCRAFRSVGGCDTSESGRGLPHSKTLRAVSCACCILALLAFVIQPARAGTYDEVFNSGFANGGVIPAGNSTGWSDSRTLSGIVDHSITDIQVKLNISGGFNGDLYGYLSHDGVLVPLLNRVGVTATGGGSSFGYGDAGFNVTLSSSGTYDIHFYGAHSPSFSGGQLTGVWQPDGRNIDPLSPPASFDSAGRISFSAFTGQDPNDTWTLFFADMVSGGDGPQLMSWELDITAIPEPVNVALAIFCVVAVTASFTWQRFKSSKVPIARTAPGPMCRPQPIPSM